MSFVSTLLYVINKEWEWFGKDTGRKNHYFRPDGNTTHKSKSNCKKNPREETAEPYESRI